MRSRLAALLAALAFAGVALTNTNGAAAESSEEFPCLPPLGPPAERLDHAVLQREEDAEYSLIDSLRIPGAQRSPAAMLNAWGNLTLVAEVKVDQDTNFSWGVFVRFYSKESGWNTSQIWLSSVNTSVAYPQGAHVRPSAVMWKDRLWVAWDGDLTTLSGPPDRQILLRSLDAARTADTWRTASDTDTGRANQHPFLLPLGDQLQLAYSTASGESDPSESHIVVREFDGSAFAPSVRVSNASDGWSDGLPVLASAPDGEVFAVWSAANVSGIGARLMFAARTDGSWSAPEVIAQLGHSTGSIPGVAFFRGRLYVAYSLDYLPDINGADFEVFWRSFDPTNASWTNATAVNPEPSNGDDTSPALQVLGNDLYASWSTDEDFYYSHGSDPDAVYRVFNGTAFGPVVELSDPDDVAADGAPHFIEGYGAIYAHWMWQPPSLPGTPRGDAREGVRLLTRPPAWHDGLVSTFSFTEVSENGSSRILVHVQGQAGLPANGPFVVRLADGSRYALDRSGADLTAWVPVEPDQANLEILACGKPLQASQLPFAPPNEKPNALPLELAVAAAAFTAVVVVLWWLTSRKGK